MYKKTISLFLIFTMLYGGGAMTALAATGAEKDAARAAKVKAAVAKLREEIIREKASTVNHEWLLEKLEEI